MNYAKYPKELMQNKRGIIFGIANESSIAYAIAHILSEQGAELIITYESNRLYDKITKIVNNFNVTLIRKCDLTDFSEIDGLFKEVMLQWDSIDFIVHSVAFSHKDGLSGKYIDTSYETFSNAMQISCYSLTYIAKKSYEYMNNGSILTLSHYGAP